MYGGQWDQAQPNKKFGSFTQFKPGSLGFGGGPTQIGGGPQTDPLQGGGMQSGTSTGRQQPIYPGQWQGGGGNGQVGGYPGQWQGGGQYGQQGPSAWGGGGYQGNQGNSAWGGGQQGFGTSDIAGLMQQMYGQGRGGGSQGWGGLQTNQAWR